MRLKLSLSSKKPIRLPFNYQHFLTAVIYRLIARASAEHAQWLHDRGYGDEKKLFKHFTFSKLISDRKPAIQGRDLLFPAHITWLVSMAVPVTLQNFVMGLFEQQEFWLESPDKIFRIESVETLPDPVFADRMKFITLSPIFVKKPYSVITDGQPKLKAEHLLPDHPEFSQILRKNLVNKYLSLEYSDNSANENFDSLPFEFIADEGYIARRGGFSKISKLITLYEGKPEETKNRAFECPFFLRGHPQLIQLAYDSGLGHDNAMGFGMIETVDS